ncbi:MULTISPECIES: cupin domain-containing protein [unclassified Pseudofrankia]|uniref:cupin domain-containing protein n=1 Tax=unclassified Pseudofrankia TaxID=2994372 RepID=UPI0008D925D5|nr:MULTISPECIES: cupin domain-containing protein [unclassified Pseudofrankia]MDT3446064.1 cupin domain-containing protein [Pseudofrankia sp. BMG5.37]OHV55355.1 cupin [Pseudofrankia sp. BMG5.36]
MSDGRFIMLDEGQIRPGRFPLPPAFAVKARTEDTGGRFSLLEVSVAVDIPRHVHLGADECIYVLDGELGVDFDDRSYTATRGMFTLLPQGVPHALRRVSTPPPRVLQISSPGGWEKYLEDLFEAGPTVLTNGALDPAKINPIAAKYHIRYEENPWCVAPGGDA